MSSIIKSSRIIEKDQIDIDTPNPKRNEVLIEQTKTEYKEIINQANTEAKKILAQANKEKENIIEEGEERKESLIQKAYVRSKDILEKNRENGYKEGYDKGIKDGYSEGYKEGKEYADILIEEALKIKQGYLDDKKAMLNELEEDLIKLVVEIYEKIIRKKTEEDSDLIVSLVLNGIEDLDVIDKITIITSKEDYDILEMSKDIILAKASMISDLDIKYDSTMEKGDCVLETPRGNIDASLKNQLSEVKEILYSVLNNE